jgi:hypothetical protein
MRLWQSDKKFFYLSDHLFEKDWEYMIKFEVNYKKNYFNPINKAEEKENNMLNRTSKIRICFLKKCTENGIKINVK